MPLPDGIFDRSGTVPRPPYGWLWRELRSLFTYRPPAPDSAALPPGNGHVVLVVPAFLTTDAVTRSLRQFLARCGYRPFGWELGVNWGPTPYALDGLRRRLRQLRAVEGGPISLIGVSLGGLLVRDLAFDCAADIRHVVTLVSLSPADGEHHRAAGASRRPLLRGGYRHEPAVVAAPGAVDRRVHAR
jgi:hypothetical protein